MEEAEGPASHLAYRPDGRNAYQLRGVSCNQGSLSRADGAAVWTQGQTEVLAAVYGPCQGLSRTEDPECATVEVLLRGRSGLPGNQEKYLQLTVKRTVEGVLLSKLHPRCLIRVVIQVLSADGALLACICNATCAALVDAAIPLRTTFVATSCSVQQDGQLVVDQTAAEEQEAQATVCTVFVSHLRHPTDAELTVKDGLLALSSAGTMTHSELQALIRLGQLSCMRLASIIHDGLDAYYRPGTVMASQR